LDRAGVQAAIGDAVGRHRSEVPDEIVEHFASMPADRRGDLLLKLATGRGNTATSALARQMAVATHVSVVLHGDLRLVPPMPGEL
jgi:hypothetical protein